MLLQTVALPFFELVCTAFDAQAEREWYCFAKAMWAVWPSVHATVAAQAERKLRPHTDSAKLSLININKIKNHSLVSINITEKACNVRQTYSLGAFLLEHYNFLLTHKGAIRNMLEGKIKALISNPAVAQAVFAPVLSENFMKTLNSCKSKVSREGLALTDDTQIKQKVILRDMFRFRV